MSSAPSTDFKTSLVFTALRNQHKGPGSARNDARGLCSMHLLATVVRLAASGHYAGPTEDELRQAAALGKEVFDDALSDLLNVYKCISHKFTQEGTAGPFNHRYAPLRDLTITAEWTPEPEKK